MSFRLYIAALVICTSLAARADTVYLNWSYTSTNYTVLPGYGTLAAAFTPTETALVTEVGAPLAEAGRYGSAADFSIYTNTNGAPGTLLTDIGVVGISGQGDYAPLLLHPVVVNAGEEYWLVLTNLGYYPLGWFDGVNEEPVANEPSPGVFAATGEGIEGMFVSGTPVASSVTPEPSSFALLGTGLLGMAGVVKRRSFKFSI